MTTDTTTTTTTTNADVVVDRVPTSTTRTDRPFWSMVRFNVWKALRTDDAVALMDVLRRTCRHEHLTMSMLLSRLEEQMWKLEEEDQEPQQDEDKSMTTMTTAVAAAEQRVGGVLSIAAGMPVGGAVRCVEALMQLPQTTAEMQRAVERASRLEPQSGAAVLRLLRRDYRCMASWRCDVAALPATTATATTTPTTPTPTFRKSSLSADPWQSLRLVDPAIVRVIP